MLEDSLDIPQRLKLKCCLVGREGAIVSEHPISVKSKIILHIILINVHTIMFDCEVLEVSLIPN